MQFRKRSLLSLCGLTLLAVPLQFASAATLYRENFPATSGMTPFSTFGWSAYYGSATTNATVAPAGSSGDPANAQVSGGPSAMTPGGNVNAGASSQTATGFVPLLSKDGLQDFIVYTNEYALNRTTDVPESFSWYTGSYYTGDTQRLVVQIDGNWYASNKTVTPVAFGSANGGQGFGLAAQKFVSPFVSDAAGWKTLNFTPGVPLTLGSDLTTALPGGPITAFGVYAEIADDTGLNPDTTPIGSERTFFDTFEVTSVPEPAGAISILVTASLLLRRRVL